MKTFNVYKTSHCDILKDPTILKVQVPIDVLCDDAKICLMMIYHFGQLNDKYQSVRAGDIIEYNDELYLITIYDFIKQGDIPINMINIWISNYIHPFVYKNFGYLK